MSGKLKNLMRSATIPARILLWTIGSLVGLILILFIVLHFANEPLRRHMEKEVNEALDGYSVSLGGVGLNPLLVSVTLRDLVLRQDAHPEPPVAVFPEFTMSLHWREIFSGRLVADWEITRPDVYVNLKQLREESDDDVEMQDRGWQEAVKQVFPLELNEFVIKDGRFTYIDEDPDRPLQLSTVNFQANNIRNIHSSDQTYPSAFRLEANIFDQGSGVVEGKADFLAEPHLGLQGSFHLGEIPLQKLHPVATKANLTVKGGVLAGHGAFEFAPTVKDFHIADLNVEGLNVDYVHTAETEEEEREKAKKGKEAVEETKEPGTSFSIERLRLAGEAGMVNRSADPDYRVFLSGAELILSGWSDDFRKGEAEATLKALFMGNGATAAKVVFRPAEEGANLDLRLRIEGTRVTSMNDLLRAYGNFDVVAGSFSVYSEVRVRGKEINGYVKPFFKDLNVYHPEQDRDKGLLQQLYEMVVGGVGQLLQNPDDAVATRADISGSLDNPEASTWQIIVQLVRNGFIKAILPGFEGRTAKGRESEDEQ